MESASDKLSFTNKLGVGTIIRHYKVVPATTIAKVCGRVAEHKERVEGEQDQENTFIFLSHRETVSVGYATKSEVFRGSCTNVCNLL